MTSISSEPTRRHILRLGAVAATSMAIGPVAATPATMEKAILDFTRGAKVQAGRVKIDIPVLLESGSAVPTTVTCESPMTAADHVKTIAIFNERNPLPQVAEFHFTPRSGRAMAATRIRLGDSQKVVAIAQMSDGSLYMDAIEVVVTLPACSEDFG